MAVAAAASVQHQILIKFRKKTKRSFSLICSVHSDTRETATRLMPWCSTPRPQSCASAPTTPASPAHDCGSCDPLFNSCKQLDQGGESHCSARNYLSLWSVILTQSLLPSLCMEMRHCIFSPPLPHRTLLPLQRHAPFPVLHLPPILTLNLGMNADY